MMRATDLFYAATHLEKAIYGESINVGTAINTTIREIAYLTKKIFNIQDDPTFNTMKEREWDVNRWQADVRQSQGTPELEGCDQYRRRTNRDKKLV